MSLLDSFYKKYNIMNQTTVDDPEGGWVSGWTCGATVEMALDDPTQTQKTIAQAQKVQVVQSALFPIGTRCGCTPTCASWRRMCRKGSGRFMWCSPIRFPPPAPRASRC